MFSDMDDTYLYDQASGQVYIRIKKGGKNYEDTFVKMGLQDSIKDKSKTQAQNVPQNTQKTTTTKELSEQQKLLQQAQELQRNIQGTLLGGD
ncbi:hypothetical protein K4G58_08300 [Helicobacter sp. Faydin-H64]|uniref:Uncharacterized protein n=2 Tax=Helicobacter turcicus TaxID=2867412 RepID=A0ABS7JNX7_9HELI|nr:hypothetical protein [Helicobacter turcicus]MBX7491059.1 hypothetical protein [Helicobacter turcicus]MBX7546320.1 hypothetical protein [Helicobacter turcicus]